MLEPRKPRAPKIEAWVPSTADDAPWERQPGEGSKPHDAWLLYRDMGRRRNMHAVAVQLGLSDAAIHEHARRWSWIIRAAQFDAYLDRERITARVDEIRKMEERHAHLAARALSAMLMPIAALEREYRPRGADGEQASTGTPRDDDLDALDTRTLLKIAGEAGRVIASLVGVERLSRGEATEIVRAPYTPASGAETDARGAVPLDAEKAELIARAMEEAGLVAEGAFQLGPAGERELRIAVDAVELGVVIDADTTDSGLVESPGELDD